MWLIGLLSDLDPKPASIVGAAFLGGVFLATAFSQIVSPPATHVFAQAFSTGPVQGAFTAATSEELYKALVVVACFSPLRGGGGALSTD